MIKQPINKKKDKVFSFLLGLVYGYRSADMELKVLSMGDFSAHKHEGHQLFYLNKEKGVVSKYQPIENPTHIVAIEEDLEEKKVKLYIYKL